jgi:hypothetical protein
MEEIHIAPFVNDDELNDEGQIVSVNEDRFIGVLWEDGTYTKIPFNYQCVSKFWEWFGYMPLPFALYFLFVYFILG